MAPCGKLHIVPAYGDPVPDHLPSILEYYRMRLPDAPVPLLNLSPGNGDGDKALHLAENDVPKDISESLVSVSSFIGVRRLIDCSGIIIDWDSKEHKGFILTTAKVIRFHKDAIRRYYHVIVRLFNGQPLEAKEVYVDYRLNIALLKVISKHTLQAVELGYGKPFSYPLKISVVGREFYDLSLKKVNGKLLSHPPRIGCDELLNSTCKTCKSCEGGPVMIESGAVVGINFVDDDGYAHLLPSESIWKTLVAWSLERQIEHFWFGLTVIDEDNLSIDARKMLRSKSDDEDRESRVYVKQVCSGSPADKAGVRAGDRVISCAKSPIASAEEYCQILRYMSCVISSLPERSGCIYQKSNQLEIRRRADDEIVTIEAELVPVNDRRFCICWPFDENEWRAKPLVGSQTDPLLSFWSPVMVKKCDGTCGCEIVD